MLVLIGIAVLIVLVAVGGILVYQHNKAKFDAIQAKLNEIHASVISTVNKT